MLDKTLFFLLRGDAGEERGGLKSLERAAG